MPFPFWPVFPDLLPLSPFLPHGVPSSLGPVWDLFVADEVRLAHTQLTVKPRKLPAPGKQRFLHILEVQGHAGFRGLSRWIPGEGDQRGRQ